jgi:hypothetical protein
MLDGFASVGARLFDLTLTDIQSNKLLFRRSVPLSQLLLELPDLLTETARREQNFILRPRGTAVQFLQLDDLDTVRLQRVTPAAFLAIETSPENFQAWVAIPAGSADGKFARQLRKGTGADLTASGATRVAGSRNFKAKYAPEFPMVRMVHRADGLTVTPAQLDSLTLVAAPERYQAPARVSTGRRTTGAKAWPSYDYCLSRAEAKNDGSGPDISRVDFTWCLTALDWGWGTEATAAQLLELSDKAKADGSAYAELTVQRAAAALARRTAPTSKPG